MSKLLSCISAICLLVSQLQRFPGFSMFLKTLRVVLWLDIDLDGVGTRRGFTFVTYSIVVGSLLTIQASNIVTVRIGEICGRRRVTISNEKTGKKIG
jgi:hypothetical protein